MPGLNVRVYECYVQTVHENDRLLDAVSLNGTRFRRVSYLLPWISAAGSGIDVVPRTGDQCLILASPAGPGRMVFVIGFKVPTSPKSAGQELGGRLAGLPQGSVALRCLAEDGNSAHVILLPGGTLMLGANDMCRTLYSPVDNSIISIFNNWELKGPGGFVKWLRNEGEDEVSYEAQYRTHVGGDEGSIVDVRVGGDGEDPVEVVVTPAGGKHQSLRISVSADGEAFIEGESINIHGRANVDIDAPNITIKGRQVLGQGDPI